MEAVPTPSRTIFIGDVHGMLDTLDQLLAELKLTATDRLIFLGDLIDKGPDLVGVIRRVAELQARGPAETHVLRGNHEDHHLRFRRNLTERPGIAQAMADSKPVLDEFFTQSSRADWNVLDNTLPFWHCPDLNILAVHGGIPGNMETFPFDWHDVERLSKSEQQHFKKIWLTRYVDRETGKFLGLGKQHPDDPFWADVYDGRFGHVVFGHEVFMDGPAFFPHATGIDTGAVHGGALTALICTRDRPPETLSVPGYPASIGTRFEG